MSCGEKIPDKAKFCPFCGEHVVVSTKPQAGDDPPEKAPVIKPASPSETTDTNITLLDVGRVFRGYTIEKMMNKDSEGIKYIAEKDGKRYVLKVFYKSSFSNMNTLFSLQMRLSRLNNLKQACTAKVAEVNQNHSPAYMAVEYVEGTSFADLKKNYPERITEDLVRRIAPKLINAAIEIRKHGLTLSNLSLTRIMLTDADEPIVLSSGITYEEVDERE
ncbi:MAG TPA: zinc-ribbon domain-containing protein, partial [Candidatus Cloacimonadota bacterium]|nr:zinc-ribbon domain-containing protein [Candidatus Cloacimonadota bacterium]